MYSTYYIVKYLLMYDENYAGWQDVTLLRPDYQQPACYMTTEFLDQSLWKKTNQNVEIENLINSQRFYPVPLLVAYM